MEDFIKSIIKNLENNGFPAKKVGFPVEKMYEIADDKGLSLNTVLDELINKHSINNEIETERIIFFKEEKTDNFENMDFLNNPSFMEKASEMLKNMSPEQIQQYQEMFQNMSDDQKTEILQKGRDMGIIK